MYTTIKKKLILKFDNDLITEVIPINIEPHRSPEKTVQINKHIWSYHNVD